MSTGVIGILHNQPAPPGHPFAAASRDVLAQVDAVEQALRETGHRTVRLPFSGDVGQVLAQLRSGGCRLVVNLCETVNEDPRTAGHPAALLELLGLPFTGSPSAALTLTADKVLTKRLLLACDIRTPAFRVYDGPPGPDLRGLRFPLILKPRYQDASIGIDQGSIFADEEQFLAGAGALFHAHGPLCLEEYIAGREFNLSLFGFPSAAPLPLVEIDFSAFADDLYPIVGYRAKWDQASFEYHHTPRVFPEDLAHDLARELRSAAMACFELFELRDYGRVDLRVDPHGRVYVLEINANPCLSPDAGFAAAAEKAGIAYPELVRRLVGFASGREKAS